MRGNFTTLTEFAQEIERQEKTKEDFLVPHEKLSMSVNGKELVFDSSEKEMTRASLTDHAHGQVAGKLGIPKQYYDRMASELPELLAVNVNNWIDNKKSTHLVRTLDGKARAFLSDKYKPIDNYQILTEAVFPALQPFKNELQVKAQALSETRMYLQIVFPGLMGEVKPGDVVHYGLTLTNSEVGAGALDVKSLLWRLVCSNGMVRESLFRKYHVGKRIDSEQSDIFKNDTIQADLKAYRLQLRDVITNALTDSQFQAVVAKLKEAREDVITNVIDTVKNVTKRFAIPDSVQDSMVQNIIKEGEINRYGLSNSITALAHQFDNPDRQYGFEKLGSQIIELSSSEWRNLAA